MAWIRIDPENERPATVLVSSSVSSLTISLGKKLLDRWGYKEELIAVDFEDGSLPRLKLTKGKEPKSFTPKKAKDAVTMTIAQLCASKKMRATCKCQIDGNNVFVDLPADFKLKSEAVLATKGKS